MPTYPYKCHKCGKRFEVIQKISAEKHTQCGQVNPSGKCDGDVERMIARSSFVLKGGGWYKDGYS